MTLWQRFALGRDRADKVAPEDRITALETALAKYKAAAGQKELRRGLAAVFAALILALGFALGAYSGPLTQAITDLAAAVGVAGPVQNSDAATAAYQIGDYATALALLRPLAERGDASAQSTLGLMYYHGRGVRQDDLEAIKWFRPAAEQGDIRAQFHLGLAYAKGEGVSQDNVSAHMWFNLAAARFPASDTRNRSAAVKNRDLVASKMTPDEIAEAQKLAREWRAK